MAFSNITGTSEVHFRITLGGPTVYQGSADPSVSPPTSLDGLALNAGDLYIRTGGASPGLYTLDIGGDTDWKKILVAGGPIVVGGNLTVGGTIDQSGPIIILNSGGAGIPVTGAGMEIDRSSGGGENVRWVWDDVNSRWAATNDGGNPLINNVYVANHLRVDGSLRIPTGTVVAPGVYFGADPNTGMFLPAAGEIGFTSGSTERWRIDGSGHFVPGATNTYDIGGSSLIPANVYGTFHLGEPGTALAPSFTFNTETDTGIYKPAIGVVGIAGSANEIARFDAVSGEVLISNVTGVDSFVINGTGTDVFLRVNNTTGGGSSGIEFRGPGGVADNWQISLDSANASQLDIEYNGSNLINVQTNGQVQVLDGTGIIPTYSFGSDPGAGVFTDGSGSVSFATNNLERIHVESDGTLSATTALYETQVTADNDIPNKKYVDDLLGISGSSWREPVLVKDDTAYGSKTLAEDAMNITTPGLVDGVLVVTGDRILYPNISGENPNVFIIGGDPQAGPPGTGTLTEDVNSVTFGDAVYVTKGTAAGSVFAFDQSAQWTEISGSGGGGGTLFFNYEVQVSGAGQTIFSLGNAYVPTATGSRLLVYVNGVKQTITSAYLETNALTVTFLVAPGLGKTVEFYSVGAATQNGILNRETQTGLVGLPNPITFTTITYVPTQEGLLVFLNGQKMILGTDYLELTSTTIQWLGPALLAPDVLEFYSSIPIVAGTDLENIDNVDSTPPTIGNDGDVLTWNDTAGKWEPAIIPILPSGMAIDKLVDNGLSTGSGPTLFNTVNTTPATDSGGTSFIQVFVNGILQKEGPSAGVGAGSYLVGVGNIVFHVAVPVAADVTIYEL